MERTHRQKKKTNGLKNKIDQLVNGRKNSHLSIENKWLAHKAVIKPIWSYRTELWGCGSKSNIVIMQRSQSKILRAITNATRYVTNHNLHTDFIIPYVSDVIHERINKNHNNLEAHPNPLLEPLLQSVNTLFYFTNGKYCTLSVYHWPMRQINVKPKKEEKITLLKK